MEKKESIKLISFGLGGFGAEIEYENGSSHLSGYDTPDTFWNDSHMNKYDYNGCWVLDKREILKKDPYLAIRSPLVSLKVKDNEVERFPEVSDIMKQGLGGAFKTMTMIGEAYAKSGRKEPGPMDYVSVEWFVNYWRKLGARVGIVEGNKFVWEEESCGKE